MNLKQAIQNGQTKTSDEIERMAKQEGLCIKCAQMMYVTFNEDGETFICRKRQGEHGPRKRCKDYLNRMAESMRMLECFRNGKNYKLP